MTHRESKKKAKQEDNKSRKPEVFHDEEIEKHKTKGLINEQRH